MGIGPGGLSTTWVIEDAAAQPVRAEEAGLGLPGRPHPARPPSSSSSQSLAVTLPPPHPPYGQMAMLRTGGRPFPGCNVKAEVTVTPRQIMGYEVEAKHAGPDFHAVASLVSTDALTASLLYHQAVTPQARVREDTGGGLPACLPLPFPDDAGCVHSPRCSPPPRPPR